MIHLKSLTGDINWIKYGGKFVSPKFNNGEFDYWLVVDFINFLDATGELYNNEDKYVIEIHTVAPSQAPRKEKEAAERSCGYETENKDDMYWIEVLESYGIFANIWTKSGNNAKELMKEAREQILIISSFTFGLAMDRTENKIGTTGWDMIRGDILAPLRRREETK